MDKLFDEVRAETTELVTRYGARDTMLEDLRKMFHMEWKDAPKNDWIQPTMSPEAFNAAIGAIRLLTATEPQVSVPFEESDDEAKAHSEELEQAAREMLAGSKRVTQRPPHYEVVFSAALYGEVCIGVSKTADLLALARKTKITGTVRRMEMIAKRTPYLFQVYNPATCYPDFDGLGLRGVLRRQEVMWGEVLDTWGAAAEEAIGSSVARTKKRSDRVKLNDWYDWACRAVWIDQAAQPIYYEQNDLEFLPVVAQVAEGSFMFTEPEQQRLPLLYALHKSGLWRRQNLSLTVLYSLVYALGSVPLWKRRTLEPGKPINITRDGPIGVLDVGPDEDVSPFVDRVVDPAVMEALQLAQVLGEQSTLNKVALGQPLKGATFSTVSLLASSGRLPLVSPKQISGEAIAQALEIALLWLKRDAQRETIYTKTGIIELDPERIPDTVRFEVNLEPDLPQDKLQQANAGQMVSGSGLASKRWVRENILNIGQSTAMDKEIWSERRLEAELQGVLALAQGKYQKMMQEMMAQQSGKVEVERTAPTAENPRGGLDINAEMEREQASAEELGESMGAQGNYPPGGMVGPGSPMVGPMKARSAQ